MVDNIDVAILNKLNELAGRYGVEPDEYVATLQDSAPGHKMLTYRFSMRKTPTGRIGSIESLTG